MAPTRLSLAIFTTLSLAAPSALAQNAAEPPAAPSASARAPVPAASDMLAPPPSGGGAGAGFAIRPNARLIMAPRPSRPVSTTAVAPHPRPRPHMQPPEDPQPPPQQVGRPRVLSTLTRVEGGLARPAVQRVMPQVEARAAQCFTRAMSMNPSVQGLMVIRFGIGPAGNVTSIEEAANYVRDSTLSDCLTASLPSLRFPPYAGNGPALAMVQFRFLQR